MPLHRTELFNMPLPRETSDSPPLIPATPNRPWLLSDQEVTLATVALPPEASFSAIFHQLQAQMASLGIEIAGCGACAHWAAPTTDADAAGHCTWERADRPANDVSAQTALASPCQQFAPVSRDAPAAAEAVAPAIVTAAPAAARPSFWQRWLPPPTPPVAGNSLEELMVERSGKRPGTIPCQVCPGRMANLGAQKCRTGDGDERTFSVWHCRTCLAYFLNDWTDKWVRTDSLEVVDIYYRLAPQEALACLIHIEAAHTKQTAPAAMQSWFESYLHQRPPAHREVRRAR